MSDAALQAPDRGFIGGTGYNEPSGFGLMMDPSAAVAQAGGVTLYHAGDECEKAEAAAARGDLALAQLSLSNAQGFVARLGPQEQPIALSWFNQAANYVNSVSSEAAERNIITQTEDAGFQGSVAASDSDRKQATAEQEDLERALKYPPGSAMADLAYQGLDPTSIIKSAGSVLGVAKYIVPIVLVGIAVLYVFRATR